MNVHFNAIVMLSFIFISYLIRNVVNYIFGVFFSYSNYIVMFSIKFFGFNVRFIVPMGGQRGFFGFAAK